MQDHLRHPRVIAAALAVKKSIHSPRLPEYLDHNIRQTKNGKVYINPFHRTTACRKDHLLETVEPVQLPGLHDNCNTFVKQRQNANTFVFVASNELQ